EPRALDPENLQPGTRLGNDYEIRDRLGQGGLATVYAALHLVSGSTRALKVARPEPRAAEALQTELRALRELDHRSIVGVVDVSAGLVPDRLTLAMERVRGVPLSRWLVENPNPARETLRTFAEDLLGALAYLEQKGVTHKDLKPDNLIVGDDGLTVIDFSLAGLPSDALFIGTARYRDASLHVWDAAADRYAAALCLFELFAGRHPFDDEAPAPGDRPRIDADDFDQPALAAFFEKALSPDREARHPSAPAMRAALLEALGEKLKSGQIELPQGPSSDSPELPLSATSLSQPVVAALRRVGVRTQGELVALTTAQVQAVGGLGKKKRKEVLDFQAQLRRRNVPPAAGAAPVRRPLWPALEGDPTDLHRLDLSASLAESLVRKGFTTVGRLATATRDDLTGLPGIGPAKVAHIVQALQRFDESGSVVESPPATLEAIWTRASTPLVKKQEPIVADVFGIRGRILTQEELADELRTTQAEVSRQYRFGLERIDRNGLEPLAELVHEELELAGGVLRLDELVRAIDERWPPGDELHAEGLVRLLVKLDETRLSLEPNPEGEGPELLLAAGIPAEALGSFVKTARQLATQWPPADPDATRRSLRTVLPEYDRDHLSLAIRLLSDLRLTDSNELYETPVMLRKALEYVLRRVRLPIGIEELAENVQR
ncbi:MAG TPA: hypothetical protein DFS52_31690, partial [Myxococcales bacterium]|nr:hypothetical protein [Myxococcales bacterium]